MAKDKEKRIQEIDKQINDLVAEKKQLEKQFEEEQLQGIVQSTTISSTVVWKEKGKEKKGVVDKLSRKSVGVTFDGKPKSIRWGKVLRVE